MAIREFRLPDPGEGLVEADIVTWRVAVGDEVKINDIVVEVETSKSLVELPTPYAGTVNALLVAEGETVEVGSPIIAIDDGVSSRGDLRPTPSRGDLRRPETDGGRVRRTGAGWPCWSATGPRRPTRSAGRANRPRSIPSASRHTR